MNSILEKMSELKKLGGLDNELIETQANEYKEFVTKQNADEVEHTTNVGFGKELVPVDVLTNQVLEMIPTYGTFVNALPGFHGNAMGKSVIVPIIGEIDYAIGMAERTSNALAHTQGNRRVPTDKVTITQKTLYARVDVSKQELNYSIVDLEAYVKRELAKSYARTIESAILNADASDLATGNINSDDAQPSVTFADGADDHRLIYDNGLRKTSLSGVAGTDFRSIGVLSWANIIETRSLLGDRSFDLSELLLLMNGATYNKAITITEFADASKNGTSSTINTGALSSISGNDLYVARSYPKTEADGKVSTVTPTHNDKGGFMYLKRQAVQFGFGDPIDMETYKIVGQGISIVAAMDFGFAVVNKKAGNNDPWVVMGINVTL